MIKKILLIILFVFLLSSISFADWEVTVSWIASTGPDLEKEELYMDNTLLTTVYTGSPTNYVFTLPDLIGQVIKVVSYNISGVPNEGYIIGTLEKISPPTTATGGSIIIKWK